MAAPHRGNTGHGTYFITASTFQKKSLFQSERMTRLLIQVLFHYRDGQKYMLHEFVIMPNHFHLLISPVVTLERALQLIKGGFSYRAKKQLEFGGEIWEKSFYDGNYPLTVCMDEDMLVDARLCGDARYYLWPQPNIRMRVPETIRKCVGFVGIRDAGEIQYGGTAFVVNVVEDGIRFFYLVTAKHV